MIDYILNTSKERNLIITIVYLGSPGISERNIRVLEMQGDLVKAYCYLSKQVRWLRKRNILPAAYCSERKRAM